MSNALYAEKLATATINFPDGSEGRIEHLKFKDTGATGYRFSWWKRNKMMPRPMDATEEQLLELFENAIKGDVFTEEFTTRLKKML